jgi:hypothetical protein
VDQRHAPLPGSVLIIWCLRCPERSEDAKPNLSH